MSFAEIANKSGIKDVLLVASLFIALWFDPRIGYLQRDIAAVAEHANQIDSAGTRHSQLELVKAQDRLEDNTRRIEKLEEQSRHIDLTLTAILNKLTTEH